MPEAIIKTMIRCIFHIFSRGLMFVLVTSLTLTAIQRESSSQQSNEDLDKDTVRRKSVLNDRAFRERVSRLRELEAEAMKQLTQEKYAQAEATARKMVTVDDKDSFAWLYLGESSAAQGKVAEALKAYRVMIHSRENGWNTTLNTDVTTRLKYVLSLLDNREWVEVVSVFQGVITEHPNVREFKIPNVKFDPNFPNFARMKARCHLMLGVFYQSYNDLGPEARMRHLKAAMKIEPDLALPNYFYAHELRGQGKFDEMIPLLRKAANLGDRDLKDASEKLIAGYTYKPALPKR